MMKLDWDPKVSFPYGIDPSLIEEEEEIVDEDNNLLA